MKINFGRFNIYLWLTVALAVAVSGGCQSEKKKKEKEDEARIELHQEVNQDGANDNAPVSIFRSNPMVINVEKNAFLDTVDLVDARVINDLGGFVIQLKFNWRGEQLLNAITTANRGKRIAVSSTWGETNRWIGCPITRKPISNATFVFTPDASREEAEHIVKGLNAATAKLNKEDEKEKKF